MADSAANLSFLPSVREGAATAIPALDNRTPSETKLVLDHYGSDYYLNKIWVQGKDYGYEFPIPDSVRLREKERNAASSVTALSGLFTRRSSST